MANKKIVSLFLALLMALGLCVTAGAEEGATITVGFWGSSGGQGHRRRAGGRSGSDPRRKGSQKGAVSQRQ